MKGFGTLGVAYSGNERAQFVRDLSQPSGLQSGWSAKTDSLIGLQANLRVDEQNEAVIQAVSRYHASGNYAPELTWAFLRHDFSPDFSVRFGRLGTEFYMLADSRLVGYANLTLRPPPDYYGPLVISYFDGIDLSATEKVDSGQLSGLLRGKAFVGHAAEKAPFSNPLIWDMKRSLLLGGHVDFLSGPWQLRLGHTQIRFSQNQPLNQAAGMDVFAIAPELSVAGKWTHYDSLGVVYDKGPLQIQAMASRIHHQAKSYEEGRAAYLIAAYRQGPVTPYLGYSRVKSTPEALTAPLPPSLLAQLSQLVAQTHSDQHTVTIGARWDFRENLALKAQADLIRGTPRSVFSFPFGASGWSGRMNVFSLALDFVF